MKKWAVDDLKKTISWLESQEEKVIGILLYVCVLHALMYSFVWPKESLLDQTFFCGSWSFRYMMSVLTLEFIFHLIPMIVNG